MPRSAPGFTLLALLAGLLPGCGKRGDPLPPLRRTPQAVANLRIAQRGDRLDISYTAPRMSADGVRLGILEVELLRADADGDFEKVARRSMRKAAPGETLVEKEPLPPPGSMLRFAARAIERGRSSALTPVVRFQVRPVPPAPAEFEAEPAAEGLRLSWEPVPLPEAAAAPSPSLSPGPSPTVTPTPSPSAPSSPSPSASPAPPPIASSGTSPGATPAPSLSPAASPSPSPATTPAPPKALTSGYSIYRRQKDGVYDRPLTTAPIAAPPFVDASVKEGETWCYVVRTAISSDPVVESADSGESCATVKDVAAPAPPTGVAVLVREGGVDVSWSPSPEEDLAHYRVYRAQAGGAPALRGEVPAAETRLRDAELPNGGVLTYTVTAVDRAGNESAPSSPAQVSPQ